MRSDIVYSRLISVVLILVISTGSVPALAQQNPGSAASTNDRKYGSIFLAIPSGARAREHLWYYTSAPHIAGSPEDYERAVYTRDKFREYGIPAGIVEYRVLLNYPKERLVEIVRPEAARFRASLAEEPVAEDLTSTDTRAVPVYNGYSASGDVTAELVYVNYGLPEDYDKLKELGMEVKGKIAIARYGRSFRGIKAMVAEERGATGLLIYSDPADDGYMKGDVYPKGPWRSASSAQRGSVQFLSIYPGDPLTPGVGATAEAKRLPMNQAKSIPRIPVQPLSCRDAAPLLQALEGKNVPNVWQGGLPFAYHTGPGPAVVHLKTEMEFQVRPIWNVIGRIEGAVEPDRLVILGNHRDAWVFGAVDPNSGSTAMLEVARGFGELLKNGWKPRRTIILASWDGEEFGLLGSTEWAEDHAQMLRAQAVAYVNVDSAVSGKNFGASASPSLAELVRQVAREITDPASGKSVYDAWLQRQREQSSQSEERVEVQPRVGRLGSGSDYTPFLQHLGIAAADFGFGGDYGVYHSIYDSFHWMEKFGDPTFAYHKTAAQIWGLVALRLADAEVLPFDYMEYSKQLQKYIQEIETLLDKQRDNVDLNPLRQAVALFGAAALLAQAESQQVTDSLATAKNRRDFNDRLMLAERAFIDPEGLPRRPWYKHLIYAPGLYAGYAADILPGLTQAIKDKNWEDARAQIECISRAIERAATRLVDKP
ncbi:MAG: M28 family metallopeptidase [Acidobacteria bacterium]|nr:M28 family metallopeptidase [Acidobacteriota bacterium]